MRIIRAIAAAAAVLVGLALPAPAHASSVPTNPFYADSGDSCTYGYTRGTLIWRSLGPTIVVAVDVSGSVVDRPTLAEPTFCRDDGFYTIATFTAYSGRAAVDRRAVKADNGEEQFQFILGGNSAASGLTHLVVQVCRSPLVTMPPSYCGKPVTYYPTVIGPA